MMTFYQNIKDIVFPYSEIRKLEKQAYKRGQQAIDKKVGELAREMFNECYYYPSWLKNGFKEDLTPYVVAASKEESHQLGIILTLNLQGDSIEFIQKENGWVDHYEFGIFQVKWFGKVVLDLGLSRSDPSYDNPPYWESRHTINGYIPGQWELALKKLKSSIEENNQKRSKKSYTDPSRLEELKRKFDLH